MSGVMESQALTDLLARAGAPDTDRPRWIAERMAGITATEVRDLAIGKVRTQALIDMKLGRTPEPGDLSHIPIIGWGRDRETVIAEALRGVGIEPESRVFHGEHNSRHLASPDGIGVDFDDALIVSEIKTSGKPLPVGSPELDAKGYVHQVQWVMHVTGAVRCRFVVEQRIQVRGGFTAGPLAEDWIERDEAAIAELVVIADEFLAEMDRQREDGAPVIDEELDTHAVNYLRAIDEEKRWAALKQDSYRAVVAAGKSQESPLARVTYTPEKAGEVLEVEEIDYEAARAAGGALFDALQTAQRAWDEHLKAFVSSKPVQGKSRAASARITAGKGTKA
ncbi:YqaJ viral recombinase family protein [uncultured Microbacterium sp.]|uniref:YqaJ viral recombinase family protein n=1 Tax=uncultured Microbacterium sp. TaxID=191216 RepID=UPI0025DBB830|nr:YqaJ viral recombinase family protein [uncultured Microbacterium sp.]